jgi:hypothetical protein
MMAGGGGEGDYDFARPYAMIRAKILYFFFKKTREMPVEINGTLKTIWGGR